MRGLKALLEEERAQSEWNSLYMLIVLIIVALLLITVVKPMFKQSQQIVKQAKEAPVK
jgi:competence protein ComGC